MRNFKENDLKALELVKNNPYEFRIMVDNDMIWIEELVEQGWKVYYDLDDYGADFIIYILNLLGYRAEGV